MYVFYTHIKINKFKIYIIIFIETKINIIS